MCGVGICRRSQQIWDPETAFSGKDGYRGNTANTATVSLFISNKEVSHRKHLESAFASPENLAMDGGVVDPVKIFLTSAGSLLSAQNTVAVSHTEYAREPDISPGCFTPRKLEGRTFPHTP